MADKMMMTAEDYQKSPVVQAGGFLCLVRENSQLEARDVAFRDDKGAEVKGQTWRQTVDFVTRDFIMAGARHKIGFVNSTSGGEMPDRMRAGVYILQPRWRLGDDGALAFDRVRMVFVAELGAAL